MDKSQAKRILNKLENELSEKAHSYPALKGRFAGVRKFRIGDFRVIYAIIGDDIVILRIAHRGEVYKKR